MFGFINDYLKKFDLKDDNFRLVFVDGNFVCAQGFKNVLKIDETEVVLKLISEELKIIGSNLTIQELSNSEILICGKIFRVERG